MTSRIKESFIVHTEHGALDVSKNRSDGLLFIIDRPQGGGEAARFGFSREDAIELIRFLRKQFNV